MKDIFRFGVLVLAFAVAFLIVVPLASAQSPFEGAWHADKAEITSSMVLLIQNGTYDCKNAPICDPEIKVKADGTDQPVSGHTEFDTISVSVSPNSFKETMKKDGKIVREAEHALSDDGNTTTNKGTIYRPNGAAIESVSTRKRIAPAPTGANKFSGTWLGTVVQTGTDLLVFTFKSNSDGLDFSNSQGASWSAKFDGKDVPDNGVPENLTLSLKRISGRSFGETLKHNGTTAYSETWTVSDDGATLTLVSKDLKLGSNATYFAHK